MGVGLITQSWQSGTNGAAITSGNTSGVGADTAMDIQSVTGTATKTYANTLAGVNPAGSLYASFLSDASGDQATCGWSNVNGTNQISASQGATSFYFTVPTVPASAQVILNQMRTTTTNVLQFRMNANGKLTLVDMTGAAATTTNSPTGGTTYRAEFSFDSLSATTATLQCAIYNPNGSVFQQWTVANGNALTGRNTGTTAISTVRFGNLGTPTAVSYGVAFGWCAFTDASSNLIGGYPAAPAWCPVVVSPH